MPNIFICFHFQSSLSILFNFSHHFLQSFLILLFSSPILLVPFWPLSKYPPSNLHYNLLIAPFTSTEGNPCGVQNGGCSHLCLFRPKGYICACGDRPEPADGQTSTPCSTGKLRFTIWFTGSTRHCLGFSSLFIAFSSLSSGLLVKVCWSTKIVELNRPGKWTSSDYTEFTK